MPRRKRVRHYETLGDAHFLTFSCHQRLPLLSKDRTRIWLAESIEAARKRLDFELWAWVFMPEHVHLLIRPRSPDYRIRQILAAIKGPVGSAAVAWLRENAPDYLTRLETWDGGRLRHQFWQAGGGQDSNHSSAAAIHNVVAYIHDNPIKRGLVPQPADWPWSSARDWLGLPPSVLPVDRTLPPLPPSPPP